MVQPIDIESKSDCNFWVASIEHNYLFIKNTIISKQMHNNVLNNVRKSVNKINIQNKIGPRTDPCSTLLEYMST